MGNKVTMDEHKRVLQQNEMLRKQVEQYQVKEEENLRKQMEYLEYQRETNQMIFDKDERISTLESSNKSVKAKLQSFSGSILGTSNRL